jgi:hypothetical protein
MGNSLSRVISPTEIDTRNVPIQNRVHGRDLSPAQDNAAVRESIFHSMLTRERRRAERSNKAFALMLLDATLENGAATAILKQALDVALITKRETDLVGWFKENAVLGVIFTEVNSEGSRPITESLRIRIETALIKHLGRDRTEKIAISLHVFPENWDSNRSIRLPDSKLSADPSRYTSRKRLPLAVGQ